MLIASSRSPAPGGLAKLGSLSRLARSAGDRYPGGVWLVELARVENPDEVAQAIAKLSPSRPGSTRRSARTRNQAVRAGPPSSASSITVNTSCRWQPQWQNTCFTTASISRCWPPAGSRLVLKANGHSRCRRLAFQRLGSRTSPAITETEAVQLFCDRAQLATLDTQLSPRRRRRCRDDLSPPRWTTSGVGTCGGLGTGSLFETGGRPAR